MILPPFHRLIAPLPRVLLLGMSIALAILFSLGAFSYHNIQKQAEAAGWVEHTYQVATALQDVFSSVQSTDTSQRMYVLSGTPSYLEAYEGTVRNLPAQFALIERLVADNPKQHWQLQQLRRSVDDRLANARVRIEQRQQLGAGALDPKFISSIAVRLMEIVRSDVQTMINGENVLLGTRLEQLRLVRQRSVVIQSLGGLLSIGLLGAVFVGLLRQINRASRAEEETKRTNAQLQEANAEMRAFSYSVAHDLRAPLRAINGFAQVLVEDNAHELGPEGKQALGRITTNAGKMDHLIDDLLALSKVSMQSLHTGRVEMNELVRSVSQEVLESRGERDVEFAIAPLPPALGDPSLLRQVWFNLIGNALKFSRNRVRTHIEIGGNVAGPEFATYFIRDNGAGFDMRYADKLFGAFQRLHRPTDFEGTGIGLALVRRIIHRHGGTIWAEGEEDKGAFFAFTLPEWSEGC